MLNSILNKMRNGEETVVRGGPSLPTAKQSAFYRGTANPATGENADPGDLIFDSVNDVTAYPYENYRGQHICRKSQDNKAKSPIRYAYNRYKAV